LTSLLINSILQNKIGTTGIKPSALRDCSTYQFPFTSLWKLEFHKKRSVLKYEKNEEIE
jgi:hypothetical protein